LFKKQIVNGIIKKETLLTILAIRGMILSKTKTKKSLLFRLDALVPKWYIIINAKWYIIQ